MVIITEQLIRKKSEHNELLISTLEELSLHQENVEKIEHIGNWCRDLKILYLQSNLISKIENLYKLKKLEYLNLAINNIEVIENLEQLESLNKLDLTLNFIGDLRSIESLKNNYNLRTLILTGNPCTEYNYYREFVIGTLQQLDSLDSLEIKLSDKIKSKNMLEDIRPGIVQAECKYRIERDEQKVRVKEKQWEIEKKMEAVEDEGDKNSIFWNAESEHCPETRIEMVKRKEHSRKSDTNEEDKKEKKPVTLFAPCGRAYNLNQGKLDFNFLDEDDRYELDLAIYKYLDTSLLECDVQPNYVRVLVKGKIFQMHLPREVKCSASTSKRSQITGHLLVVMPKLNFQKANIIKISEKDGAEKTKPKGLTKSYL